MLLNTLLVLALIGLVTAVRQWRRGNDAARPLIYGLLGLVTLLVLVRLFAGGPAEPPPVRIAREYPTAAAYRLGREIARTLPGGGDIVVVVADTGSEGFAGPIVAAQIDGLREGMGDAYRLVLAHLPDEPPFVLSTRLLARLTAQAAPEARAVVSLAGSPEADARPARELPPLFVIDMIAAPAARPLIARGIVRAGVFVKPDVDWRLEPEPGMTLDEVFDLRFVLVTRDG